MNGSRDLNILTINSGSSSIKAGVYRIGKSEELLTSASVDRIGSLKSLVRIGNRQNERLFEQTEAIASHTAALEAVLTRVTALIEFPELDGIGQRVVLGDERCLEPMLITEELLAIFNELASLAPDHIPPLMDCIAVAGRTYSGVPQVACSDSGFHRRLPLVAQMYGIPRRFHDQGIWRYGFHGLSCEYVMQALAGADERVATEGRVIIAHLGNGASITAVKKGASVDTSMGLTPAAGLVMGTRCGDLDPGAVIRIGNQEKLGFSALNNLLNKESGLLGISGYSADMRDLIEREAADASCAEAVAIFCYQVRKFIGAYVAALGGLDTLVFTGGIGEYAATIRERICADMDCMGITLDPRSNASNASVISTGDGPVTVRVMKTDEDLIVARHTCRVVTNLALSGGPRP